MQSSLLFDIGGTWIKAALAQNGQSPSETIKTPSPLRGEPSSRKLANVLLDLADQLNVSPDSVAISTAGIINEQSTGMKCCSPHLLELMDDTWVRTLEEKFQCPITLANDADCALIGAAQSGFLSGQKTIGLMVIGTGLGFCVWRNGRRWRPHRNYTLLCAIETEDANFDTLASATRLAANSNANDLCEVLNSENFSEARERYFSTLASITRTAATLYRLDEVAISGGLVDAALSADFDLSGTLSRHLGEHDFKIRTFQDGNRLQILGTQALAEGESIATKYRFEESFENLPTEQAYDLDLQLQDLSATELVSTFLEAEQTAGQALLEHNNQLAEAAESIAARLQQGGRLIYIGAGSSGRIAALDAVELPCTYGLEDHRAISLIAGGLADAAIEIETRGEEDASAVPEMLLLNLQENDIVLGISASASAYYVRSALAYARSQSALTILISATKPEKTFFDQHLPLWSGGEVVSGSTRMKAGTATKKILNTLTSTAMILNGKVNGTEMIDLACLNEKLISRATSILSQSFSLSHEDALALLKEHRFRLADAIHAHKHS
ncbi:MAG: N-acetylmuramic acid 6-phosphate etherase [Akkermansiaceae bacterium]